MSDALVPAAATALPSVIHSPCGMAGEGVRMTRIPSTLDTEGRATTASPSAPTTLAITEGQAPDPAEGVCRAACPSTLNTAEVSASAEAPHAVASDEPHAGARAAPQNWGEQDQHLADEPRAAAAPQFCGEENQHLGDVRHAGAGSRHDGANPSAYSRIRGAPQNCGEENQSLGCDHDVAMSASQEKDEAGQRSTGSAFSPELAESPLAKNDASRMSGLPRGTANFPAPGTPSPSDGELLSPYGTAIAGRRGFLRGLLGLPLIGGAVSLIGQPTAVAEPVSAAMLLNYKTWLQLEHRFLCWELAGADSLQFKALTESTFLDNEAAAFHRPPSEDPPSARAALVLSTVGCGWRSRRDHMPTRRKG